MAMEDQNDSSSKAYDVVILGALGFTGKYVTREALKFLNAPNSPLKSLALAGRSPNKLAQSLQWAASPEQPPQIPILTANISDPNSLHPIATQTKLILNCVGPFRLYGEPVVATCIEMGCHYLDICGEPEFMERIEATYHEKTVERGVLVISACGFDSIPAELGLLFRSRQWASPTVPNKVQAYISIESEKRTVVNFATYESAVLRIANAPKLMELRQSRPKRPRPMILGPPPPKGPIIEHQQKVGLYAVKLPSADAIVVGRTLANLTKNPLGIAGVKESSEHIANREAFWSAVKPAHFGVKIGSKSLLGIFRFIAVGMFIGMFGKTTLLRWLLLNFPSIFSLGLLRKKGPTEEEIESVSFKMWFIGHGYSDSGLASRPCPRPGAKHDTEILRRVSGPEMGYLTTSIIPVQCALVHLERRGNFA